MITTLKILAFLPSYQYACASRSHRQPALSITNKLSNSKLSLSSEPPRHQNDENDETATTPLKNQVVLIQDLNVISGDVDKAEGAVVDVGKIGEAAVLELAAKGLLKGLVHKGHVGVLEDREVGESDGVIVGAPTAPRP
jgi:hypothetical protein